MSDSQNTIDRWNTNSQNLTGVWKEEERKSTNLDRGGERHLYFYLRFLEISHFSTMNMGKKAQWSKHHLCLWVWNYRFFIAYYTVVAGTSKHHLHVSSTVVINLATRLPVVSFPNLTWWGWTMIWQLPHKAVSQLPDGDRSQQWSGQLRCFPTSPADKCWPNTTPQGDELTPTQQNQSSCCCLWERKFNFPMFWMKNLLLNAVMKKHMLLYCITGLGFFNLNNCASV